MLYNLKHKKFAWQTVIQAISIASPQVSLPLEGWSDKWYWTKWYGQNGTDKMSRRKW